MPNNQLLSDTTIEDKEVPIKGIYATNFKKKHLKNRMFFHNFCEADKGHLSNTEQHLSRKQQHYHLSGTN